MTTILNIEAIATDEDLANKIGRKKLETAMPDVGERNTVRSESLADVLSSLRMRTPAVHDTDLSSPAELKNAVVYRSLHTICRLARHNEGDGWDLLSKDFRKDFDTAMSGSFTVGGGQESPAGLTFSIERR